LGTTDESAEPRDFSPGHAGCTLAMHDDCICEHPEWQIAVAARLDADREEEPRNLMPIAEARERLEQYDVQEELSNLDAYAGKTTDEFREKLEILAQAGVRDFPPRGVSLREALEAALAQHAAEVVRNTADATGTDRDLDFRCLECGSYGRHAERCSLSPEVQREEIEKGEVARKAEAALPRQERDLEEYLSLSREATPAEAFTLQQREAVRQVVIAVDAQQNALSIDDDERRRGQSRGLHR
jgi:hypothetical protein